MKKICRENKKTDLQKIKNNLHATASSNTYMGKNEYDCIVTSLSASSTSSNVGGLDAVSMNLSNNKTAG